MSFFPLLFIPLVGCKTPNPVETYGSRRYVLIREHHWIVFSSQICRVGSFSIHFFYFPHLFINIFSFKTLKITFPPSIKGFQSLQGVWKHFFSLISSARTFSSFHQSFLLSKSKNSRKISCDFNLLTFLSMDLTLTRHYSNLKIIFEELSIDLFDT